MTKYPDKTYISPAERKLIATSKMYLLQSKSINLRLPTNCVVMEHYIKTNNSPCIICSDMMDNYNYKAKPKKMYITIME